MSSEMIKHLRSAIYSVNAQDAHKAADLIEQLMCDTQEVNAARIYLRDKFAGLAMQGLIVATADNTAMEPEVAYQTVSVMSYAMADSMLAEREKDHVSNA